MRKKVCEAQASPVEVFADSSLVKLGGLRERDKEHDNVYGKGMTAPTTSPATSSLFQ